MSPDPDRQVAAWNAGGASSNFFRALGWRAPLYVGLSALVLAASVLTARSNYLLFHCIVELSAVAVAWSVFLLVWNARAFVRNDSFVLLGIAYLFVGGFDLLHTLFYKGMGVFPLSDQANRATQLWIAGRALESAGLLAFAALLCRKVRHALAFVAIAVAAAVVFASIFVWDLFPACYVEGVGLTAFKANTEYAICGAIVAAMLLMWQKRRCLDRSVLHLAMVAMGLTVAAEISFTRYVSVYGPSNQLGHILKLFSEGFVYLALIRSGLTKPYALLFREVEQQKSALQSANRLLQGVMDHTPVPVTVFDASGRYATVSRCVAALLGREADEVAGRTFSDLLPRETADTFHSRVRRLAETMKPLTAEDIVIGADGRPHVYQSTLFPVNFGDDSRERLFGAVSVEITGVREAVGALQESERRLRTLMDNLPGMAYRCLDQPGWPMEFLSDGVLPLTGYRADEIVGSGSVTYESLIHPEDRRMVADRVARAAEAGRHFEMEYRIITKSGEEKWVWEKGCVVVRPEASTPDVLEGFIADITDRETARAQVNLQASVLQQVSDAVITTDLDQNVTSWNQAAEEVYGWSASEAIGRNIDSLLESEFADETREHALDVLRETGAWEGVVFQRRKDGCPLTVEAAVSWIRGPDGRVVGGVTANRDITRRREAEEALRRSEEQYRAFVAHTTEGIYRLELDEPIDTGLAVEEQVDALYARAWIAECNDAMARMYGLERGEELVGRRLVEFHGGADDPANRDEVRRFVADGYSVNAEDTWETTPTGERRCFANNSVGLVVDGRLVRVWGSQTDITARRLAEAERQRLMSAIGQAAETVMVTDADANIQYVNPAFESLTGYTREEVIGKNPRFLKSGRQDAAFYEGMWNTLLAGDTWQGRLVNRRKDGSFFTEEVTLSPVRDAKGVITNYVGVKRDISEQLVLEEQLKQTQKMEAIGTLAGGIAHDFNNILSAVIGYAELAREEIGEEASLAAGYTDEILRAGNRARELVGQILAFSRKAKTERQPLHLSPLLNEATKLLRAAIPSSIEMRVSLSRENDTVFADATQIHQVVMNLCTNAWQAMREQENGILELRLDPIQLGSVMLVGSRSLPPGRYVRITVSDTGSGVSAENLERIFDPFFTTKQSGEGTGMGLAVVHGVVQEHGGAVSVRSKPGEGTVFEVVLPMADREGQPTQSAGEPDVPRGAERILLVDDEESIRVVVGRMLTSLGYHVTVRRDGREALETVASKPDGYDLVLTDLTMPNLTGTQFAVRVREIAPELPLVLSTGYGDQLTPDKVREVGFSALLMKPLRRSELAQSLRKVLDGRSAREGAR